MPVIDRHVLFCYQPLLLTNFWCFAHCSQTTGADIHVLERPIHLNTAMLNVQNEATTSTMLRVRHIIAIHRLAFADITTACCHVNLPPYVITDAAHQSAATRSVSIVNAVSLDYLLGLWYFQSQIKT